MKHLVSNEPEQEHHHHTPDGQEHLLLLGPSPASKRTTPEVDAVGVHLEFAGAIAGRGGEGPLLDVGH